MKVHFLQSHGMPDHSVHVTRGGASLPQERGLLFPRPPLTTLREFTEQGCLVCRAALLGNKDVQWGLEIHCNRIIFYYLLMGRVVKLINDLSSE